MPPVSVSVGDDSVAVAVVEFENQPYDHFNLEILTAIADAYERLDSDPPRDRFPVAGP